MKCLICGKKYYYDSKICQECEDYSVYSGVADLDEKTHHKWTCSVFLEIKSTAYKTSSFCELKTELSPEQSNLVTHERKLYDWNCELISQLHTRDNNSLKTLTLGDFFIMVKSKSDSYLLYE